MTHNTAFHVSEAIRGAMSVKRVSQAEIAAALGLSQAAVSRRLSGQVPLDVNELAAIASLLGISASDLLRVAA